MIISHEHRYLFVELPRTGSTAIRRELRELYAGTPILHKHATYSDFLRVATPAERSYFVFSAIRHPMDSAVSRYFKLLTDHKGKMSSEGRKVERDSGGRESGRLNRTIDRRMFEYLRRSEAEFSDYFMRYYWLPYDTWSSLSHEDFDVVMRFEDLGSEFERALTSIGIGVQRPLPQVNTTSRRARDFASYYEPRTRARARRVFGPYMERWGYAFPADWAMKPPTSLHRMEYRAFSSLAGLYWRHVRGRI
jgi:hypothetical protein